jgi:hypothetical protein
MKNEKKGQRIVQRTVFQPTSLLLRGRPSARNTHRGRIGERDVDCFSVFGVYLFGLAFWPLEFFQGCLRWYHSCRHNRSHYCSISQRVGIFCISSAYMTYVE